MLFMLFVCVKSSCKKKLKGFKIAPIASFTLLLSSNISEKVIREICKCKGLFSSRIKKATCELKLTLTPSIWS